MVRDKKGFWPRTALVEPGLVLFGPCIEWNGLEEEDGLALPSLEVRDLSHCLREVHAH